MPDRTADAIHFFSPASQGYSASSFTPIGPPIASTRSTSRQSGSLSPSSSSTVSIAMPCRWSTSAKMPGGSHLMCCKTSALAGVGFATFAGTPVSANHEHGPVCQVDHLVRGASEYQPGEIAPATRAHDDDARVMLLGVLDDLAGGVPEDRVPHLAVGIDPCLGQLIDRLLDGRLRLDIRLGRYQPHPVDDLPLSQMDHPDLALGQRSETLGCSEHAPGNLGMVHRHQQSLVHRSSLYC